MNKVLSTIGLVILTLILGSFAVSALTTGNATAAITAPATGANLSGLVTVTTTIVDGSAALYNLTNLTVYILNNNVRTAMVGTNTTLVVLNATTFTYSFTLNTSTQTAGYRTYRIDANYSLTNATNGSDTADVSASVLSLTIDNSAATGTGVINQPTPVLNSTLSYGNAITLTCAGSSSLASDAAFNLNRSLQVRPAGLSSFSTVAESLAGNATLSYTATTTLGIFQVRCIVTNSIGNSTTNYSEFEVIPKVLRTGAPPNVLAGEQTVAKTFVSSGSTADLGTIPSTGISRLMASGAIAKFMVNGEEHQVTVMDIVDGKVTLELQSTPQTLTMVKGDVKQVDFDADGNNDLKITLHGFDRRGRADLTFEAVAQPGEEGYVAPPAPAPEPTPEPEGTGSSTLIIIIVLVVIIIVGYLLVRRKN